MNTNNNIHEHSFDSPGDRLNHLLDQIGFKQGRGRVADFQNYLSEHSPELSDLKYTTVRSWFLDNAPPMRKIGAVIEGLQKRYVFHHNISHIKTWWKVGGFYPFVSDTGEATASIFELQQNVKENEDKLQFIVMSLVTEETGELFKTLSSRDLMKIKDFVVKFGQDFADPFKTECPLDYLKMAVRHELSVVLAQK